LDTLRLVERIFIRLFLIVSFLSLQSCSNTQIGEKLENSFDMTENPMISEKTNNKSQKTSEIPKIKSRNKGVRKEIENDFENIVQGNSIANKDRLIQKKRKSENKATFNPQPYRIILRLSGANPSAPAESVTEALRKADVQFEVEKIERFNDGDLSKDRSLKR
tara:strand:+ start:449 stop:937 length:489 start_codon:yes stop_codon:yes gene_type:complete